MMEIFFEIPESKYGDGIFLQEYNGKISLVSGRKGKEGTNHMRWCYPQKDKGPAEKAIPWQIGLGLNRQSAATLLQKILSELAG